MAGERKNAIGFDQSHENKLNIESPAFSDFMDFLFTSNFKLGTIQAGLDYKKLSVYDLFIIGLPQDAYLEDYEIVDLVRYVKDGGSLLVINDQGGDIENKNNLSILTKHFGIYFNSDKLFDKKHHAGNPSRPIITNFKNHFITNDIAQIIHSNGCTLTVDKSIEEEQDIDFKIYVTELAYSSEKSSYRLFFNGKEWVEESNKRGVIFAVAHYGLGKVAAIGNLSLFSSLQDLYGIKAGDNFKLITNTISWLLNKAYSEKAKKTLPVMMTTPIEHDLYTWMRDKIQEGKWNNIKEIINFALRVIKLREEKLSKSREFPKES
ncbi:MAG: hypothetical protein ACTSYC_05835 [Promethearchaeota archaeon]